MRIAALAAWLAATSAQADWQMKIAFNGYAHRKETLTNFPVLVVLSNNVGGSGFDFSGFSLTNGCDLRFVTNPAGSASLNYEIESWNTGGASYVWVQVPAIPPDGSGAIWARWGDPAAKAPLPCLTNGATWDRYYQGVWHLAETAASRADSSAHRNSAVTQGVVTKQACAIGLGDRFMYSDGDDYLETSKAGSLEKVLEDDYTIETWFRPASRPPGKSNAWDSAYAVVTRAGQGGKSDRAIGLSYAGDYKFRMRHLLLGEGSADAVASAASAATVAHHVVGVVSKRAGWVRIYLDGQEAGAGKFAAGTEALKFNSAAWRFGLARPNRHGLGWPADGAIDEVRLSTTARSADWIWASHLNQASNTHFSTYRSAAPVISLVGISNITETGFIAIGRILSTGFMNDGAAVIVFHGPADGGTNASAWAKSFTLKARKAGLYGFRIPTGDSNTMWNVRLCATNINGMTWSASTESMLMGAVAVRATGRETFEDRPASFVISRPAAATNGSLAVNFALEGGINGRDFDMLDIPAIIPDGAAEIRMELLPGFQAGDTMSKIVTLRLVPGAYSIGPQSSAKILMRPPKK